MVISPFLKYIGAMGFRKHAVDIGVILWNVGADIELGDNTGVGNVGNVRLEG